MGNRKIIYRLNFSLRPTSRQEKYMDRLVYADRWVYNSMLAYSEFSYLCGEPSSVKEWKALLPELKRNKEYQWLKDIPAQVLQESTLKLGDAFKRFFSKNAEYPKFKKKASAGSFRLPQPNIRMQGKDKAMLFIPLLKSWTSFKLTREIKGIIKGATITKSASGEWGISLVIHGHKEPLKHIDSSIGIDLGLKHFMVDSNGIKISSPNFLRKSEGKLKRKQRSLSKKKKGSSNYKKQCLKIARLHKKISNQRKNFIHNLSRRVVDNNQIICLETLRIENMIRNSKLSKSISDAGWGMFISQLKYKSDWAGRSLRLIDQWSPSSKMCSKCGIINGSLTLREREWTCVCGAHHDRDVNAAINILKIGMDTPEFKPVEKLTAGNFQKKIVKVDSEKQEPKTSYCNLVSIDVQQ